MKNNVYDLAVVGAGAAGVMSAIRAGMFKKNIVLIERNESIGKKILLTGRKRCNITNLADIDTFISAFEKQGKFLRQAFNAFFNHDLIEFFKTKGLMLKVERQDRVFPVTDKASSVVNILKGCLMDNKRIRLLYNTRLADIKKKHDFFQLDITGNSSVYARKVILATGGVSYKATGSSGDGFRIAKKLGHTVVPLKPALVPLKTRELWVKQLQGLSLKNIRVIFSIKGKVNSGGKHRNRKIISNVGEISFTHFGVSGPLILDLSGKIIFMLHDRREISLFIDLKPGLNSEQIENRLLKEFEIKGSMQLKNAAKSLLPHRLIPIFLHIAGVLPEKKVNQISRKERHLIGKVLKSLPLTVSGSLSIDNAMVTNGGISTKEIEPGNMESKIIPGLYFAGEIIDGCAFSGGYNLQQAFSTGYLAGESAARA